MLVARETDRASMPVEPPVPGREAWPLFGLRLRTSRLELVPVNDVLIPPLARVARAGIHDPGASPFANGWTDRSPAEWETGFARYFWSQRGSWTPGRWALPFAVLLDGNPIGVQQLTAEEFPVRRTVGTGSWLSLAFQGHGIGTEMREAVLHFSFEVLGAEVAVTGAYPHAIASVRISERIGYVQNGTRRDIIDGRPVDAVLFRLSRDDWRTRRRTAVEVEGFEGCESMFGIEPVLAPETLR
jgi:RimJ/RimL family protein N-acetyltransferase